MFDGWRGRFFVVVYFTLMLGWVDRSVTYPATTCVVGLIFVFTFSCFLDVGSRWAVCFARLPTLFYPILCFARKYGGREIAYAFFAFLLLSGDVIGFFVLEWICVWNRWYSPSVMLFPDIGAQR